MPALSQTRPILLKMFGFLLLALPFAGIGCHAQVPSAGATVGSTVPPALARRIEVMIRQRTNVSPEYTIAISPRMKSTIPNFQQVSVTFTDGKNSSKPIDFLISEDGKTLAQFSTFDISQDPRMLVSEASRPARGGPVNAPVTIVEFDDLECPYCAKMHAQLFPALLERYKDQVHIVYRDFPLSQHPWAMRAAIDSNCLATVSAPGYWNLVDYVHLHAGDIGGAEKSVAKANEELDALTLAEGKRQKVDGVALAACVQNQDDAAVKASMKVAEGLGVDSTPALFINGEKLEGAVPMEYLYRMIDGALVAEGLKPPASSPVVAAPAASATGSAADAKRAGGS